MFRHDKASASTLCQSPSPFELDFNKNDEIDSSKLKRKSESRLKDSPRLKGFKTQNEQLIQENSNLNRLVKKLQSKAEERKKNLKEMFGLLTEKDIELSSYKSKGKEGSETSTKKVGEIIKRVQEKLGKRYVSLHKKVEEKEKKIQALEEDLVKLTSLIRIRQEDYNGQMSKSNSSTFGQGILGGSMYRGG